MNGSCGLAAGRLNSDVRPSLAWQAVGIVSARLLLIRLGFEGMREGQ